MSILSAALTAKLADFAVRVAISLGIKFNNGPFHRHAEKRRLAIKMRELEDKEKEEEAK